MSSLPLYARFINQIYQSASHLYEALARHPYCVDPQSNFFLHQFEGLALHCYHFAEKNGLDVNIDQSFKDLVNSIKHIRDKPKLQIELQSGLLFEVNDQEKYRFIRNIITAKYINDEERPTFDAIDSMHRVLLGYIPFLEHPIDRFSIPESSYPFYDCGLSYIDPILSAFTRGTRIITVRKSEDGYVAVDPETKSFVVLDATTIGEDPRKYFP